MSSDFERQADDVIKGGAGILLRSCRGNSYTAPQQGSEQVVVMEEKNGHTVTVMIVRVSDIRVANERATLIQDGEPVEGYAGFPITGRAFNVRRV